MYLFSMEKNVKSTLNSHKIFGDVNFKNVNLNDWIKYTKTDFC